MKVAESVLVLREPVGFRELCERVVPARARYLVFDLDRTLYYRRNIGELLGFELTALEGYGQRYLDEVEPFRKRGRFHLAWRTPLRLLRYLWAGKYWIPPGLAYWWWCRVASKFPALRRLAYARFGDEPIAAAQRFPQHALFGQMARHPAAVVRALVDRVVRRYEPDLVLEREDVEWLRSRWPGARVILSSASPQPVVEGVARSLGFDEAIFSTPSRINGGRAKVEGLLARHPDLPQVESVGFSDNGYGEDSAWTTVFSHLAAVNGKNPFPPLAPEGSPLQMVCSAALLTRAEKRTGVPDPRRTFARGSIELGRTELEKLLAPLLQAAGRASSAFRQERIFEQAALACLRRT